jgi:hypothetical protein
MKRRPLHFVLFAALTLVANAASTILPALPQRKPVLLSGGMVVPVSEPVLERGDVLLIDGRISQVGAKITPPAGAEVIDARGKRIYPLEAEAGPGQLVVGGRERAQPSRLVGPVLRGPLLVGDDEQEVGRLGIGRGFGHGCVGEYPPIRPSTDPSGQIEG